MVMKLICVMCLGAHSRMERENINERQPPLDNFLSSPIPPGQALHPALGGQNKLYISLP